VGAAGERQRSHEQARGSTARERPAARKLDAR